MAVWGSLTNSWEKKRSKRQRRKGKIYPIECRVSENSKERGKKKVFLSEQCKEIEKNNRMGKTKDLFKKIRDIKRTFLSFIVPIFAWNVPLVSPIFLKQSLVFPILLFYSISLHCSLKKTFLSLLAILWNSTFNWVYLSLSPLPFASLLFSTICNASSDNHFAFLHFFSWGWFWSPPPE